MEKLKPKMIIIEPTSRCNLKCKFCPSVEDNAPKGINIDVDFFKSIIDRAAIEFPGVSLVPWLNGEPLLHPRYTEMMKYIASKNLKYYITTNGTIWNEELFQHLTDPDSTCYQVIVSLDGLYEQSAKAARPGTDFKKVTDTIERLMQLKKDKKSKMDLAVKICRRGQDYEEVEDYVEYWIKKGIDYVCVGNALTEINETSMRHYPCQYSDNNFMEVRADGHMIVCSYNEGCVNDYKLSPGFLNSTESLLEAYNNKKYTEFRTNQANGIFNDPCDKCGFAYTGKGFYGKVKLRSSDLPELWYHSDYYNHFYSLTKNWKDEKFYSHPLRK